VKHDGLILEAQSSEEPGDEEDEHEAAEHQTHKKDRSRFSGEVKGGTNTFRPRASRGGQRGS